MNHRQSWLQNEEHNQGEKRALDSDKGVNSS